MTIQARFKSFRRRLHADADKGSAAVEFAVVAPVFFLILLATLESGVVFFAQSTLQNAVNDASRLVRTGQTACFSLDSGGKCAVMTADQFRSRVCDQVHVLLRNCSADSNGNSDLQFDIRAYPSGFTGLARHPQVEALLKAEVERANAELARVEQIKAFRVLPKALDPEEEGEPITPTRKVKRQQMYERFRELVESMYDRSEEELLAKQAGTVLQH